MKRLINVLIFILFPLIGFATAQAGDILIYKGDTLILFSNPLEQYLETKTERTINDYELTWTSTACYRGYQATWELTNDSLYLIRLQKGCYSKEIEYFDLAEEFGTEKVFANWFTGNTLAPSGDLLHYVHNGYGSFYEKELLLTFSEGVLIDQIEYDNSMSYKSVYTKNKDSLQTFLYTHINWSIIPDLKEKPERVLMTFQSSKSTKPVNIRVVRGSDNETINEEAIRVMNELPEWDVYYRKGEAYKMTWTIPIIFNEKIRKKYTHKKKL